LYIIINKCKNKCK